MTAPAIVVVGNGQGGMQAAMSLREGGHDGRIVLIGDEPDLPYQRPPLSKAYLSGEATPESLFFRRPDYFQAQGIAATTGARVTRIDRGAKRVEVDGATVGYDHLILATGARDRSIPLPGAGLDGVCRLRTRQDADALRARLPGVRDVVVIGAGFIGLEFAAIAVKLGKRVHVIEMAQRPMARAVTPEMSAFFHARHAAAGVSILFSATVRQIAGSGGRVTGVETADGLSMPADLVVLGVGVRPNSELAAECGLPTDNGIVVDEWLLTPDPAISAIGDCAAFPCRHNDFRMTRLESVQNAADQARTVAARLLGRPAPYRALPWFWSEQGSARLQIAGLTAQHDTTVVRGDQGTGAFSVFAFKAGHLVGVESVNRPADHMIGRRLLTGSGTITTDQAADQALDLKCLLPARGAG